MKKIMLLGGSKYLLQVIKKAHDMGLYVITCDYLPNNIAHKYADEYCNASVIDKEKVLKIAIEKKIDGIMSFACDPGVVSAAYVAEKMGLPFQCSYKAASILQDKGLFRQFLIDNGFNSPKAKRYGKKDEALQKASNMEFPVIVKPTDSAGSKGVTKVDNKEALEEAIDIAVKNSHNGAFIIEEFLEFEGYHSSTDPFTVDGTIKFNTYSDQLFDPEADNPYTPAYIIWPSSMKKTCQDYLTKDIQRLFDLLNVKTGIYNIETCVANNSKPYIMEVSPRGGGCKIAELQSMAFGIDFIGNEIKKAVGLPVDEILQTECNGYWCEMVVHARPGESGVLKSIWLDKEIEEKYLILKDLTIKEGDYVKPFTGANMALGDMFFKFDSREELDRIMSNSGEWCHIELKNR